MLWPTLITALALVFYAAITAMTGSARGKYNVKAPKTVGNDDFERRFRVQQNTMEQLVLFLPSLWLFAIFISHHWAAAAGVLWLIGRILFAWGYYSDSSKRFPGMVLTFFTSVGLLLGGLGGLIWALIG